MLDDVRGIVAYYRVSTQKQGRSGLGLEVQRNDVERYALTAKIPILKVFTEIESGKKSDRPQLKEALAYAKRQRAELVVAKLDRLGRNLHFISSLMVADVKFRALDFPEATTFTLHIMAAIAEYEGKLISERTKAGLGVARDKGILLGGKRPNAKKLTKEEVDRGRILSAKKNHDLAVAHYQYLRPQLVEYRAKGMSRKAIAHLLNDMGEVSRGVARWCHKKIGKVMGYLDVY